MAVEFRLLGSVEAWCDGAIIEVGPARQRCVLVALSAEANRVVSVDQLVDRVWGNRPPPRVRGTLRTYLSRLRQTLAVTDAVEIARRSGGYVFTVDPLTVDLHRFHDLVAKSRAATGDDPAFALVGQALGLWRGEAFAGLDTPWINTLRDTVDAARLAAELDHADLQLRRGQHGVLLAELTKRAMTWPLDERIAGQLMLALYRCGRQADALTHYGLIRSRLAEELGADPSPFLQELHRHILVAHPVLACPDPQALGSPPAIRAAGPAVPRELPPSSIELIGRDKLLGEITGALQAVEDAPSPVVLLVGPGGVGKTALAVAAAHGSASAFPDGQLYADLRGNRDSRADPHALVGRFLRSLGADGSRLPEDPEERVAMYRSYVAGKRILVMLDDAASEQQVRPLLTGMDGCRTLITSRYQLGALVGAVRWTVPVLTPSDAEDLFTAIIGRGRVDGERDAAAAIVGLCAQLPLAVSIAAARLAVRPHWTLDEYRRRLAAERGRLDELSVGDFDVRASIALSYHALDPDARLLFRRLGLVDAPTWPAWIADPLIGSPAAHILDRLTGAHLVEPVGRDAVGQSRFRLHDLVAEFAAERARADDSPAELTDALSRLLSGWLALATEADQRIPHDLVHAPTVDTPPPPVDPAAVARQAPGDWFEAERRTLVLAVDHACRLGLADIAGALALRLSGFLGLRSYGDDWETVLSQAVSLVRKHGSRDLLAHLLSALFMAYLRRDRHAELTGIAAEELAQARLLDDRELEVRALGHAALAAGSLSRYHEAIDRAEQAVAAARHPDVADWLLRDGLSILAFNTKLSGRPERALPLLEEALAIDRAAGTIPQTALHLYRYGMTLVDDGRPADAEPPLAEALRMSHEHGHVELTAYLEQVLADVAIRKGQLSLAADRLHRARSAHEKTGSLDGLAEALRSTGDLAAADGRWADAITWLCHALDIWRRVESRIEIARTLARLERAHTAAGAHQAARSWRRECQTILADLALDDACLYLPPFYLR